MIDNRMSNLVEEVVVVVVVVVGVVVVVVVVVVVPVVVVIVEPDVPQGRVLSNMAIYVRLITGHFAVKITL
jgi:hypothetical protein